MMLARLCYMQRCQFAYVLSESISAGPLLLLCSSCPRWAGVRASSSRLMKAPGMHIDGGGLYLRIGTSGAKSWVYRYRNGTKLHDLGLGNARDITLAEARDTRPGRSSLVDVRDIVSKSSSD